MRLLGVCGNVSSEDLIATERAEFMFHIFISLFYFLCCCFVCYSFGEIKFFIIALSYLDLAAVQATQRTR